MSRPQEVRPGAKVPRSGIYQDNLSQRRATLVKGEPAPPTPHKAGRWQQVVDTASAPTYRALPWTLLSGVVLGAGLILWVWSAPTRHEPRPPRRHAPASGRGAAWCWPSALASYPATAWPAFPAYSGPSACHRVPGDPEESDTRGQTSTVPDEPRGRRAAAAWGGANDRALASQCVVKLRNAGTFYTHQPTRGRTVTAYTAGRRVV
jgi:hypothetical protein